MNKKKFEKSIGLINEIVNQYDSMRAFAKAIYESPSDVSRWCSGKLTIKTRAVIEICRLHMDILPHDLNHLQFPEDLKFKFTKDKT